MRYISILPRSAMAPIHHTLQFRYDSMSLTAHAWHLCMARGVGVNPGFLDSRSVHQQYLYKKCPLHRLRT
jgi:hypothetical protein